MIATAHLNLLAGWIGMLAGAFSGAIIGLYFHNEAWLGGYAAFRRRMLRLGHIAFFGLSFINLLFYFTAVLAPLPASFVPYASFSLLLALLSMPLCCFLSTWQEAFRYLFPIPVLATAMGVSLVIGGLLYTATTLAH